MNQRPEAKIQAALVEYMEQREWLVEVTHGNAFQKGLPDMFAHHIKYGYRWIDAKVPGRYSFTKAQKRKWPQFERHGCGIWILTAATEEEYDKLFQPPNWRQYWKKSYGELPDINAMLKELWEDDPSTEEE